MTSAPKSFALRRALFMTVSTALTVEGFILLLNSYGDQQKSWLDWVVIGIFPLLFSQISIGLVLALLGFFDRLRGGDPHHLMRRPWRAKEDSIPLAATAIVVPVYNEDIGRVSRAIANMWQSLEKTGQIEHFDFYICSDSNVADRWVEEECAWMSLCQRLNGFGKIFYRKRRHSINGKSGNVADFCRRWGKRYRYMIVLDADSVMTGTALVRMVRAMEANPEVGILQTQPYMVLGTSLFRRVLQFSSHVYGGLFSQGCSMAQMSSGSYWGHNAIIRIAPFIEYCDLPNLPVPDHGKRHVLSHDTVEAALMRRAGYEVWIAYDEPGSYEEGPPNLSDMLKRDRRWCAGNLQHFWFLFARGIELGSRLQIWIGLMAYLCSPLWFAFLVAGSVSAFFRSRLMTYSDPQTVGAADPASVQILFFMTLALLFVPRILGICISLGRAKDFGGAFPLVIGAVLENILSILLAPVLMIFHSLFVVMTIFGIQIKWTTQNRSDTGLTFGHCLWMYGWMSVLGAVTGTAALHYLDSAAWWLTPIFVGWMMAPVLAWMTSLSSLGLGLKKWGLFTTPEETKTPPELQNLEDAGEEEPPHLWTQALLSPYVHAVHLSMVRQPSHGTEQEPSESLVKLRERLIREGPQVLTPKEKLRILWDAETVYWLHRELWSRAEKDLHPSWAKLRASGGQSPLLARYLIAA